MTTKTAVGAQRVTITEVARQAEVSRQTVSNALNYPAASTLPR